MADLGAVKVRVHAVVDTAALDRAREKLRAAFDDVVPDPVMVADLVEEIIATAPVVRWVMT